MNNTTVIVSDLHLGSKFSQAKVFLSFLDALADDTSLVLNGDTVTHWNRHLSELDFHILDRLREESLKRKVLWINGNHDHFFKMKDKANIQFAERHFINDNIIILHGHQSDWIRMLFAPLMHLTYFVICAVQHMGMAKPMPTSAFAKKLSFLYKPYNRLFIWNTVRLAKKNNCNTIICGHVHHVDDREHNGVRYINTGSWTEDPVSYIEIKDGRVELKEVQKEKR